MGVRATGSSHFEHHSFILLNDVMSLFCYYSENVKGLQVRAEARAITRRRHKARNMALESLDIFERFLRNKSVSSGNKQINQDYFLFGGKSPRIVFCYDRVAAVTRVQ